MKTQRVCLGLLLVAMLLLASCSSELELTLYRDQEWEAISTFTFDPRLMPQIAVGGPILEGIGLEVGLDTGAVSEVMLQGALDHLVGQYRSQGVEASWRRRRARGGDVAYTVTAEGQGWDRLESAAFQGLGVSLTQTDDEIHFTLPAPFGGLGLGLLFQQTFRLRGGRIIASNAHEIRGGTAVWYNPTGTMEAVLTPATRLDLRNPAIIAGLSVVGVGVVAAVVYFLVRARVFRASYSSPRPPRRRW